MLYLALTAALTVSYGQDILWVRGTHKNWMALWSPWTNNMDMPLFDVQLSRLTSLPTTPRLAGSALAATSLLTYFRGVAVGKLGALSDWRLRKRCAQSLLGDDLAAVIAWTNGLHRHTWRQPPSRFALVISDTLLGDTAVGTAAMTTLDGLRPRHPLVTSFRPVAVFRFGSPYSLPRGYVGCRNESSGSAIYAFNSCISTRSECRVIDLRSRHAGCCFVKQPSAE